MTGDTRLLSPTATANQPMVRRSFAIDSARLERPTACTRFTMRSQEQHDPTFELLRRLPELSQGRAAAARARRRCHFAMARRKSRRDWNNRAGLSSWRLSDAFLMLSMAVYLWAAIAELVRVARSL